MFHAVFPASTEILLLGQFVTLEADAQQQSVFQQVVTCPQNASLQQAQIIFFEFSKVAIADYHSDFMPESSLLFAKF